MTRITKYELLPTQYSFLFGYNEEAIKNSPTGGYRDVALYQGGFGSGKTFCGSLRGLYLAFTFAGSKGLVGAATQFLLDNTTKAKYEFHLTNMGLEEGVHWWYSDRKTMLHLINGSTIYFKTVSNWENFRSTEFTWIELEEASLIDEATFKELLARLREDAKADWKNPYKAMFLHTNPQGCRGWIYKYFHSKKTKIPSYRAVIAPTTENVYLGKEYVESLKEIYSAQEANELIYGTDNNIDNTVAFPDFNVDKDTYDNIEYDPNYNLILTCDFNYNPMCWYLVQYRDNNWYILKELIANSKTTKDMCNYIQPILDSYSTREITVMGDAHGRDQKTNGSDYAIILSHLSDAGYSATLNVMNYNPLIKDRLAVLRGIIRNANGDRRLKIHSSCEKLIYNLNECVNNLSNGGLKLPTDKEIQNDPQKLYLIHPIDAVSYPMYLLHKMAAIGGEEITKY